eukprot:7975583-Pyramimonas_sp.AAC.1
MKHALCKAGQGVVYHFTGQPAMDESGRPTGNYQLEAAAAGEHEGDPPPLRRSARQTPALPPDSQYRLLTQEAKDDALAVACGLAASAKASSTFEVQKEMMRRGMQPLTASVPRGLLARRRRAAREGRRAASRLTWSATFQVFVDSHSEIPRGP